MNKCGICAFVKLVIEVNEVFYSTGLVCSRVEELRNVDEVAAALKTSIGSKQYGHENFLSSLIARACGEFLSFYSNKQL